MVSVKEAQEMVKEFGAHAYVECSALYMDGVSQGSSGNGQRIWSSCLRGVLSFVHGWCQSRKLRKWSKNLELMLTWSAQLCTWMVSVKEAQEMVKEFGAHAYV